MQYVAAKRSKTVAEVRRTEKTIHSMENLIDSNQTGEVEKRSAHKELEDHRMQYEKTVRYTENQRCNFTSKMSVV